MTRISYALALGASLALCSVPARAQQAQHTPVPDMKPDLSSMSYLIGTWSCRAHVRGTNRPDRVTFKMDLTGRWITGDDTAPPFDKYRNRAIRTYNALTYNPDSKKWVSLFIDSFGNYGVATSPGWNGNKLTTTAVVTSDGSTGSDTLTKNSDTQTTDVASGKDKNGKPNPTTTTVCTKT